MPLLDVTNGKGTVCSCWMTGNCKGTEGQTSQYPREAIAPWVGRGESDEERWRGIKGETGHCGVAQVRCVCQRGEVSHWRAKLTGSEGPRMVDCRWWTWRERASDAEYAAAKRSVSGPSSPTSATNDAMRAGEWGGWGALNEQIGGFVVVCLNRLGRAFESWRFHQQF